MGGNRRSTQRRQQIAGVFKDALRTTGVSLVVLCLIELSLHLCGARFESSLFQMDPIRNFSFRPGASGWRTEENDVFVHINRFGNRDRERSVVAEPGTLRIAVLGSSYTAALEVEQQETYTAMLERDLSRPGAPVEVLNFGVAGYGPAQVFYTLHDQVWSFHPQIVMDEVSLKQSLITSVRKLHPSAMPYPYFRLSGDSVIPDEASQRVRRPTNKQISTDNQIRTMVNAIDLILLATSAKTELGPKLKSLARPRTREETVLADARMDPWNWALIPPSSPEIEQGWEILYGLIRMMRDESAAHGSEFWVIASDDPFQVNPDPAVGGTMKRAMGAQDLTYGDDRLDHFLSSEHIEHIHLEPALLAYVQRTGSYLHGGPKMLPGEGHWNPLGHRVVAQIMEEDLLRHSHVLQNWERTVSSQASKSEQATDERP